MNGLKRRNKKVYVLQLLSLLLFMVIVPVAISVAQKQQNTRVRAAGAMPHVQGNQIIDGFGNPLILRGAHIQSTLERIGSVATPSDVLATQHLNSGTFDVMYNSWHMNTLRLATSDWIWQSNPTAYIQVVQRIVAEANQSGLYVVISLHEDLQSGLPSDLKEPNGWSMPTSETIPYWQAIASTFKNNPMVMFDVFNEPHLSAKPPRKLTDQDWQTWLHGGIIPNTNYQVYGVQDLVNTIRSQGAKQIIIVQALANSFQTIQSTSPVRNLVVDPSCNCQNGNIVYSVHQYFQDTVRTPATWDLKFGNFSSHVPIFIGEWAFQVNSTYKTRCDNLTPDQATQMVENFLAYMDAHGTSWTAFAFTLNQMFLDYKHYTPTTLYTNPPWVCGDIHSAAGMGIIVKQYLLDGLQAFTPTPTPSPTDTPTATSTP